MQHRHQGPVSLFAVAVYTIHCLTFTQVGRARFRAPELLFHPVLIGEESEGIHQVSLSYCEDRYTLHTQ